MPTQSPDPPKYAKVCNRCGVAKHFSDFHRNGKSLKSICKICVKEYHAQYHKEHRDAKREYARKYYRGYRVGQKPYISDRFDPLKRAAHIKVSNWLKLGKFYRRPCEECGEPKAEFHHTNGYAPDNWFVGKWLCRPHHAKAHVEMRKEVTNE